MARWNRRPEGSNWGDFGPDDQIGRLNWLTPEKLRQGIAEVRDGRSFCLSLPLDLPGGNLLNSARHPPQRFATRTPDGTDRFLLKLREANPDFSDVVNDDRVMIHTQYSTQWDSFAHVGSEFDADGDGKAELVFYNGWRGGEHITAGIPCRDCGGLTGTKATRLGIETIAETCVQGRAVLIDLHAAFGDDYLDIDYAALAEAMNAQSVIVERGDMVCLHTGFGRKIMEMRGKPDKSVLHGSCTALEGRDPALHEWVRDSGLVALIADNYAVERVPSRSGTGKRPFLPLHELCLFKLGVPLAELLWLSELADYLRARERTRFLLTAPPLRLPGAVGSPMTPVATV